MDEIKEVAQFEYRVPARVTTRPPVTYPETDGAPMAETDVHRKQLTYLLSALDDYFRADPLVYVAGNLFLYYKEGAPWQVVAPDVFVVKGVPKGDRRVYQLWQEGKAPDVVIELTSRSTREEDLGPKKGIYEMLGVQEYFIFDPLHEYLEPSLVGFRLSKEGYRPIQPLHSGAMVSQVLGLELQVEGRLLRLVVSATGEKLLTPLEVQAARRKAEAELERLRAELARLRQD